MTIYRLPEYMEYEDEFLRARQIYKGDIINFADDIRKMGYDLMCHVENLHPRSDYEEYGYPYLKEGKSNLLLFEMLSDITARCKVMRQMIMNLGWYLPNDDYDETQEEEQE